MSKQHLVPKVIELRQSGIGSTEIAKQLGIGVTTVNNWLRLHGMTRQYRKFTEQELDILMSDLPCSEIMDKLDLSCENYLWNTRYKYRHRVPGSVKVIGPFSETECEKLTEYRELDYSMPDISRKMNRSIPQIRKQLRKMKQVKPRVHVNYSEPWGEELDTILKKVRDQGGTTLEMSEKVGKTEPQVKARLKVLELKTKNSYVYGLKL